MLTTWTIGYRTTAGRAAKATITVAARTRLDDVLAHAAHQLAIEPAAIRNAWPA